MILTLRREGSGRHVSSRSCCGTSRGSVVASRASMKLLFSLSGVVWSPSILPASHLELGISLRMARALATSPRATATYFWSELIDLPNQIPYLHGLSNLARILLGTNQSIFSPNSTRCSLVSLPWSLQNGVFWSGPFWYLFSKYAAWFTIQLTMAWSDGIGILILDSSAVHRFLCCSPRARTFLSASPLLAGSPG